MSQPTSTGATAPLPPLATRGATVEQLSAVAAAAAAKLPSPAALRLGPVDGSMAPSAGGPAVVASFTGAVSGTVVVLVDPALEAALAGAEAGALPLADAIAPAVADGVAALGPAVTQPPTLVPSADVVADASIAWAPLVAGEEVSAWVGLVISGGPAVTEALAAAAASVPAQRVEGGLHLLRDVEMVLTVELGRTRMSVRELLALAPGSVVELDRAAGAPADLMVNGRLLARGEVVVVDEDYGLRITEIVEPGADA